MLDVLIKNAKIIDGSGRPAFTGCVGIKDGKIAVVRETEKPADTLYPALSMRIRTAI